MITLDALTRRRDALSETQIKSQSELELLKEKVKVIKKEVANMTGAIIEIDHMIESL